MCATCGCSGEAPTKVMSLSSTAHHHHHDHHHHDSEDHHHVHHDHHTHEEGSPSASRTIRLEQDLLAKNNRLAERNRGWLEAQGNRGLEPGELAGGRQDDAARADHPRPGRRAADLR